MIDFKVMSALITPFKENGKIDYDALERLVHEQMKHGVDGFIVCGTTAETPTLKESERFELLSFVLNVCKHQVEVWFGCGTNCTKETLRLVRKASYYDIDGVLLVTPYYNKPSQNGLYTHFKTIANEVDVSIMLYQVPSRCGVSFEERTLTRLFRDCPNIVALKHASNDYEMIEHLHASFPNIRLFSGEDRTFTQGIHHGLCGLISVMANYGLPQIKKYLENPSKEALGYLEQLSALTFLECSPAAVKYMLSREQKCKNVLRLPLVSLSSLAMRQIDAFLQCDKKRQSL